ncbi:MAG: sugar phosphate nucleotidyltransferase [Thermodesulfovibrionales bacterium]|nr:sugar phosphate nucleotidyltransferase [Thermodesulfovibrionales bacterium]
MNKANLLMRCSAGGCVSAWNLTNRLERNTSSMINGFILAAGFGNRLRPITDFIPKPLLPILGKPIIDYVINSLISAQIKDIGLNLHYRQDVFDNWLTNHKHKSLLHVFFEKEILGTGGALKNAEPFLSSRGLFVTHNADVFCNFDILKLINAHDDKRYIATLAVVDHPQINTLTIDENGFLSIDPAKGCKKKTFTGIAVYSNMILDFIPKGFSSITDAWSKAMQSGFVINTFDISDCYWSDIGSIDNYAKTIFDVLQREGKRVYVSCDFKECHYVDYEGFLVIERGCSLEHPSRFKDCIILPKTRIDKVMDVSSCIVGNDFVVNLQEDILYRPLGTGGSNRSFFRDRAQNVVSMFCPKGDSDFDWHIRLAQYFYKNNISIPRLISYIQDEYIAVFEDVGDLSLYDWLCCQRDDDEVIQMYSRVIDEIIKLHTLCEDDDLRTLGLRQFDYQYFRWETDYFIENFVRGLLKFDVDKSVYHDLDLIAKRASSFQKTIIHRDLQSQNIMIKSDKSIVFIDYQSARMGPPAYDIASLCFDPYVKLPDILRNEICDIYISKRASLGDFDETSFRQSIQICKVQRLMQALGAYAFLSIKRGKKHFIQHIPSGIYLLKIAFSELKDECPSVFSLIQKMTDSQFSLR